MNILDALADPALFGGLDAFATLATWRPWLAFLRAFYGLAMDAADLELFRAHTGRETLRAGGYPEAVVVCGVQSGKSRIAAVVAAWEAIEASARGARGLCVPLIAQDARGAQRTLLGYVRELFDAPVLRAELTRDRDDALVLRAGVTVGVYPARPAAVRGIRAAAVVLDELAWFIATDGRPTDVEMLRAVRTRVAMTGGRVLILSSPYGQAGALWTLHRMHYGRDESSVLVWQASAPAMNPLLPADYLQRMERDDPEAYRSEVLGEFRAGLSQLLDPEAIQACVESGVRERARDIERPRRYVSFVDAASGSGKDSFTAAIAHKDGERSVLDVVRAWRPPFNPSGVIEEAAGLLKSYGLSQTTGDRYAPGFVAEGFRAHGITYKASEQDRSQIYLELVPAVNARSVLLLDEPELLKELRGLERRRGTSGRDRVDHRPGQHDDRANAAAGALVLVAGSSLPPARYRRLLWG